MAIERDTNNPERVFTLGRFLSRELREISLAPIRLANLIGEETSPVAGKIIATLYLGLPIAAGVAYLMISPDPWVIAAGAGGVTELIAVRTVTTSTNS